MAATRIPGVGHGQARLVASRPPFVPWFLGHKTRDAGAVPHREGEKKDVVLSISWPSWAPHHIHQTRSRLACLAAPSPSCRVPLILFAVPLGWPSSPHTKPLPPPSLGPLQPPPLLSLVERGGCWSPLRDWTPVQVRGDRPIRGGRGRGMGERKGNAPSRRRDLMGLQGEAGAWGVNAGGYQGQNGSILV